MAPCSPTRSAAFTLIETILVVSLVGVLISLLLPALARVRWESRELKSLANLRSHAAVMSGYAGDWAGTLPCFTDPNVTMTVVRGGGVSIAVPYFDAFATWNIALCDEYYAGNVFPDAHRVPWRTYNGPLTFYWYPECFISRPEYWDYATRLSGTSQWRPTRLSEVVFPAQKGLVWEQGGLNREEHGPLATTARFALSDGSAREWRRAELARPYVNGTGVGPGLGGSGMSPVMHTIGGVRGRDLK